MKRSIDILLILAILAITAIYCSFLFGGYERVGDGNDYAGLARSIVEGKGFQLGHVYPLGLVFNQEIPQPNNIWAPGYPVYLAFWFMLLGPSDIASITASICAIWLFVMASYFLGRAIGGLWMARMAASLAGLSQLVLSTAIEGTPEILGAAILTAAILCLFGQRAKWKIVASGLLFGVTVLIRYQVAIVAIPLIWLYFSEDKKVIWLWLAIVLAAISPWLIRNFISLGNPFFTLQSYGEFSKSMGRFSDYYYTYRSFFPMSLSYVVTHFPLDFAKKFLGGLIFLSASFPLRFNFLGLAPFFLAVMKSKQVEPGERRVILFAAISAVFIIILSSIDGHHDRHLLPIQGFLIVSMLIGFKYFIVEIGALKYKIGVVLMGALLFLPARAPFLEMRLELVANMARASKPGYEILGQLVEPNAVVVSDASDAVWWYAERNSIWIPAVYGDLRLLITNGRCDYVYLIDVTEFYNSLTKDQFNDFVELVEPVDPFLGPGELYRVRANDGIPDSFASR